MSRRCWLPVFAAAGLTFAGSSARAEDALFETHAMRAQHIAGATVAADRRASSETPRGPTRAGITSLFPELAIGVIEKADQVDFCRFPAVDQPPLSRTVAANPPVLVQRLSKDSQNRLTDLVLRTDSYAPAIGIASSCVFYPNVGFRFRSAKHRELWFLVSTSCRLALFATPSEDWREKNTQILSRTGSRALEQMVGTTAQ